MKKGTRFNLSKSAMIGCLIAVSAFSCTGVSAYGAEVMAANTSVDVMAKVDSGNLESDKFIIDSRIKNYTDLDKATRVAGFDFKVPDFLPEGYIADNGIDIIKQKDSNSVYTVLSFSTLNKDKEFSMFDMEIFKDEPMKFIKERYKDSIDDNIEIKHNIKSEEKTIGNIKGEEITIETSFGKKGEVKSETTSRCFVWKDNGVYYLIDFEEKTKFNDSDETDQIVILKENDIMKIAESMKKPSDVRNVKYFSDSLWGEEFFSIYDKEDLKNAEKSLGFTPECITKVDDKVTIHSINVQKNNNKCEFIMAYTYNKSADAKDNIYFEISEMKDDTKYKDIKDKGINAYDFDETYTKLSKAEKITINNKDVYKIKEVVPEDYKTAENEYKFVYMWEKNGLYYKLDSTAQDDKFDKELETLISKVLEK